ncbi:hypothetical protein [Ekhidna lutea]|nr:hypothetical protein [Ekhidna lutea]
MRYFTIRQFGLLLLLAYSVLAAGQVRMVDSVSFNESGWLETRLFLFDTLPNHEVPTATTRISEWSNRVEQSEHVVKIKPQSSDDFNVYLTFRKLINSTMKTELNVSLNNAGIVSVKHTIALRKREK